MIIDDPDAVKATNNEPPPPKDANNDSDDQQPKRIRKRRKIRRTVTYMEGKYMKTKDETDWESYSDDEKEANKNIPAHKQISNNQKSNNSKPALKKSDSGSKMVQKNISSFFKKANK